MIHIRKKGHVIIELAPNLTDQAHWTTRDIKTNKRSITRRFSVQSKRMQHLIFQS